MEALKSETPIDKLFIKSGEIEGSIRAILAKAKEAGIVVIPIPRKELDAMSETGRHQGIIALCPAFPYVEVEDILAEAKKRGEDPFVIILDGVTDPHNLGAIIRTAEAAGAHGVIIPKRRAVGITAACVRASAGAAEHMRVAKVSNLVSTIKELKDKGVWVMGAAMEGEDLFRLSKNALTGPLAIAIGGEGGGLSRLVQETCDFLASIPMKGKITSLNASVAAAVIMYEAVRIKAQ